MDKSVSVADINVLNTELQMKSLQLRRIDAELSGVPPVGRAGDDAILFAKVESQYTARRQAYLDALDTERAALARSSHDLKSALEIEAKLRQTLPIFREQEKGWNQLAKEGFAGKLMALDRTRSRIEIEQELNAQTKNVEGLKANIVQANKRIAQITSVAADGLRCAIIDDAEASKERPFYLKSAVRSATLTQSQLRKVLPPKPPLQTWPLNARFGCMLAGRSACACAFGPCTAVSSEEMKAAHN
jgi:hypothetical protein